MESVTSSSEQSQGASGAEGAAPAQSNEYQEMLKELNGEVSGLKAEKESMSKVMRSSQAEIERIKKAVSGETERSSRTPDDDDSDFANMFLDAALEDQKAGGKGLPLTTKLALEQVENRKVIRQLREEIKKLAAGHQQMNDPEVQYDREAYSAMDLQVQNALQGVYGDIDQHMFKAVTGAMADEIKALKANKPGVWAEIRRNPDYQRRMCLHFVEKFVPPKARQIMTDEKERNTPMSRAELKQAMAEAKQIQDPTKRAQVSEMIRQKLLEEMYSGKR